MSEPRERPRVVPRAVRRVAVAILAGAATPIVARPPLLAQAPSATERAAPAPVRLRIGIAPMRGDSGVWRSAANGIRLGVEEASRAATMLGGELTVREGPADELLAAGVDLLLGGADARSCEALADAAERARVLYIDVVCGPARERGALPRVFHVAVGEDARRAAGGRDGEVVLWHPSLERFGAEQLNARHRARYGEEMDAGAWAGWMAVKIAWETAARLDAARGETLAGRLATPRARFDGHKGRALFFDPGDHVLRQPLYLVRAGAGGAPSIVEIAPQEWAPPRRGR